jgi:hypothetical protein
MKSFKNMTREEFVNLSDEDYYALLDDDEIEIEKALERGEFQQVPNFEQHKKELERMAKEDMTVKP